MATCRVVVCTSQTPFARGGAEYHASNLVRELEARGYVTDLVTVPFKWYPPERILDSMLACRLLDLTEADGYRVDVLIGLKFPAYLVPHPNKTIWLLHQHRPAYDLWGTPLGDLTEHPNAELVRESIAHADRTLIPEAKRLFANSRTVARRLKQYCGIEAAPLYHPPPDAEQFYTKPAEEFFFYPSRITPNKRQLLVLEALAKTRNPVRVAFASPSEKSTYAAEARRLADHLGLKKRVEWLGNIDEAAKREQYARSLAVIFPPVDEDYGYVTLEAMLASKAVITCSDSGGPLEFVEDGATGLTCEPAPERLAAAMDRLWENRREAERMGQAGREQYAGLGISWDATIRRLVP